MKIGKKTANLILSRMEEELDNLKSNYDIREKDLKTLTNSVNMLREYVDERE